MKKLHLVLLLLGVALLSPQSSFKAYCDPPRENRPQPRGVRIAVHSYFVVTNSDDGVRDNDVETYGYLNINDQRIWAVQKRDRIENVGRGRRINAGWYDYVVMFDKPAGWALKLNGYLKDYDRGSDDDGMWNPMNIPRFANIKAMYEDQKLGRKTEVTVRGDRDSESADLVLELGPCTPIY